MSSIEWQNKKRKERKEEQLKVKRLADYFHDI
jgi:hypothetical protein